MWKFLNGKKTGIGAGALMLAVFLSDVVAGTMGVTADWIPKAVAILEWVGVMFGGTGLAHKGVKASNAP